MIEAGAWDGIGSSVVGGLIGALTVMLGAFLAYRYAEKSRLADREQAETAKAREDRLNAANGLIIEISNLRDEASSKRNGLLGDYALFPLRNALFVTHVRLEAYPSYQEVRAFYKSVRTWRDWARDHKPPNLPSTRRPDEEYARLRHYQEELRAYAEQVINLLLDHREDQPLAFERPTLPRCRNSTFTRPMRAVRKYAFAISGVNRHSAPTSCSRHRQASARTRRSGRQSLRRSPSNARRRTARDARAL
jgi:hypothetical protein